ncbi:hypothetical protein [Nonomuraea aurantiaca]|uniref:hypothetical protein n=1 Tax=Nonomuraea aurantiaca TaxID=2878562 RepID=UPI001CD9F94A|nr:hypothetical protein [Nonomuraea aurantiaca]MCA2230159.1 hypothetical protein [Nonomuraea aurantiaca]
MSIRGKVPTAAAACALVTMTTLTAGGVSTAAHAGVLLGDGPEQGGGQLGLRVAHVREGGPGQLGNVAGSAVLAAGRQFKGAAGAAEQDRGVIVPVSAAVKSSLGLSPRPGRE